MATNQPLEDLYPVHPQFLNHDIMHSTVEWADGEYLYSGRALGITTTYDIIQLHRELMDDLPAVCQHYDRIGLSYTNQVIWNTRLGELENYPHYDVSYFHYGEQQHAYARHENWFRVVDYINSKNHFVELARQLGMRVPFTLCFHNRAQLDNAVLTQIPFPCYLKAADPTAGVGMYRCENEQTLLKHLAGFGEDMPFQIQEELGATAYLNLQYQVVGSRLERLATTERSPDRFSRRRIRHPTPHNAWYSVEPMAKWMFCQGTRGVFTFDVAVVEDDCGTDYIAFECHPGFNGASYPALIARKLGIKYWQAGVFHTRYRKIADLPLQGLEYDPERQTGIVLVNWGTVQVGKLFILLAGTPEQQVFLQAMLEQRL